MPRSLCETVAVARAAMPLPRRLEMDPRPADALRSYSVAAALAAIPHPAVPRLVVPDVAQFLAHDAVDVTPAEAVAALVVWDTASSALDGIPARALRTLPQRCPHLTSLVARGPFPLSACAALGAVNIAFEEVAVLEAEGTTEVDLIRLFAAPALRSLSLTTPTPTAALHGLAAAPRLACLCLPLPKAPGPFLAALGPSLPGSVRTLRLRQPAPPSTRAPPTVAAGDILGLVGRAAALDALELDAEVTGGTEGGSGAAGMAALRMMSCRTAAPPVVSLLLAACPHLRRVELAALPEADVGSLARSAATFSAAATLIVNGAPHIIGRPGP